jgi:hypothetical protein
VYYSLSIIDYNVVEPANLAVCQGTDALNPWQTGDAPPGKRICTFTLAYEPAMGNYADLYLFDQRCTVIGHNDQVSLDDLANPAGWGFASELPFYLVVNVPAGPLSHQITMWYDSLQYIPFDFLPYGYSWFFDNGYTEAYTAGVWTMIRASFAC